MIIHCRVKMRMRNFAIEPRIEATKLLLLSVIVEQGLLVVEK